jgi:hypothetical protein
MEQEIEDLKWRVVEEWRVVEGIISRRFQKVVLASYPSIPSIPSIPSTQRRDNISIKRQK